MIREKSVNILFFFRGGGCVCVCVHLSCGYRSISASQVLAEAKSMCSAGFHGNLSASLLPSLSVTQILLFQTEGPRGVKERMGPSTVVNGF